MSNTVFKCLKIALALCLTVTAVSQLLLLIPAVGGSLPASGVAEFERFESPTGQVEIKLKDTYAPNSNIKILINGMEAASLSSQSIRLTVINNSVIEVDGRRVPYPFEVILTPLNSTICQGNHVAVDGNLVRLSRVFANPD